MADGEEIIQLGGPGHFSALTAYTVLSRHIGYMEVHHIRAMKGVKDKKKGWQKMMSVMYRKTMVLCFACHTALHGRGLPDWRAKAKYSILESRVHRKVHARFGGGSSAIPNGCRAPTLQPGASDKT